MPRKIEFSRTQMLEIGQRYREGETLMALARKFRVSVPTIARVLDEVHVQRRERGSRRPHRLRDAAIIAAVREGLSYGRVAKQFKISRQRVHQIIKKGSQNGQKTVS